MTHGWLILKVLPLSQIPPIFAQYIPLLMSYKKFISKEGFKVYFFLFKEHSMLKLVKHAESFLYANNENSQCVQIYIGGKLVFPL